MSRSTFVLVSARTAEVLIVVAMTFVAVTGIGSPLLAAFGTNVGEHELMLYESYRHELRSAEAEGQMLWSTAAASEASVALPTLPYLLDLPALALLGLAILEVLRRITRGVRLGTTTMPALARQVGLVGLLVGVGGTLWTIVTGAFALGDPLEPFDHLDGYLLLVPAAVGGAILMAAQRMARASRRR